MQALMEQKQVFGRDSTLAKRVFRPRWINLQKMAEQKSPRCHAVISNVLRKASNNSFNGQKRRFLITNFGS